MADVATPDTTVGNRRTHHEARKRLRRRLEARGLPADEIAAAVDELRQHQAEQRGTIKRSKRNRRAQLKLRLLRRDGDRCTICGGKFTEDDPATIDHVKPKVDGGTNAFDNLRLTHRSCNHIRGQGQDPRIDGRTGRPHARGVS